MISPSRLRTRLLAAFAVLVVAAVPATTVSAQAPKSLDVVPADVAFYSASLRLREQYDAFVASNAFAKLKDMPIVQMGWQMFQQQLNDPEGDFAQFKQMYEQPENKQLVELLIDAFSHEVFSYGDEGFAEALQVMNEINSANQKAQLATLTGGDPQEAMLRGFMEVLDKRLAGAEVPDFVIGFRISDKEPAMDQLARLEQLATGALGQNPAFEGRFARKQIAGGDFLTLELDGSLIPWDQIPRIDAEPGFIDSLREKVTPMTLAIALGVKDDFLLLSIGDSTDHLEALGQAASLASRKELATLKQHAQKPITSVMYVSETFMTKANSTSQQIDQFTGTVEQFLPFAGLDPDLHDELVTDVKALGEDIKSSVPRVGAVSSFSFRSARGLEGYYYNWGENQTFDGSKPLSILNHVGGDPLCVFAGRGKYSPESYDKFSKWGGKVLYYAEKIALDHLGESERDFFNRVRDDLKLLVKQLDDVTRDKLLPAFEDGQFAVVFDAKTTSEQLHTAMPPGDGALPVPELAFVYGLSDADALKDAASSYFEIAQKVIDVLHKAEPTDIPDFQIPPPDSKPFAGGTIYYYRLPRQAGLDKQIAPNAGLSDETLVLSMVPKMTVRLIEDNKLQGSGPLADTTKPLAAAFQFNFAGLLDAVAPWVDYAIVASGEDVGTDVTEQIQTGFEIGKCWRGISGVTYQEGAAWVSHYEIRIQDLP